MRRASFASLVIAFALAPAALASHESSGTYRIPIVPFNDWRPEERVQDVVIVPPQGNGLPTTWIDPRANVYLRAQIDSTLAWNKAFDQFAPAFMSDFEVRVFVLGRDIIPPDAVPPDAIIASTEYEGVALAATFKGGQIGPADTCIVVDALSWGPTPLDAGSFSYSTMWNANAHEFGHCLGLDHVVDQHPLHDLMGAGYPHSVGGTAHLHCPSNLDVLGVAAAAQHLYGFEFGPGRGARRAVRHERVLNVVMSRSRRASTTNAGGNPYTGFPQAAAIDEAAASSWPSRTPRRSASAAAEDADAAIRTRRAPPDPLPQTVQTVTAEAIRAPHPEG